MALLPAIYFHVSDLAGALIAGAERELDEQRIFNIGDEQEVSLIELLRRIEESCRQASRR